DDLDAGDKDLRFRRLLDVGWRFLVNGALAGGDQRAGFIDGLADNVHDTTERLGADRNGDRGASVRNRLSTNQTFGRVHGDRANPALAKVRADFKNEAVAAVDGFQRVQDRRQLAVERNVNNSADDLGNPTCRAGCGLRRGRFRGSCLSHVSYPLSLTSERF